MGATDPRDKVFAVLGISEDDMGLQPNYNFSCREVFVGAMMAMLRSGEVSILSFCRPHLNNIVLPS